MWLITVLISLSMALVNFFTILAIEFCVKLKFSAMQAVMERWGVALGILTLTGISMFYALVGVSLIECFAPSCGGSGLPENKCFLNGSKLPGFFTKRTLRVRVLTVILSNAAGFPVGREGPTVVIGSNVGFLISEALARPYVQEWVDFSRNGTPAIIVDEERFEDATRIACAVGGACGMAMIFNAPFGGFLYMFEEMTSVAWPWELTFRVFVATMCCALVSYGMLNLCGTDILEFVIFLWVPQERLWQWSDVPWFVLMSAILGLLTSWHTRGCLFMSSVRQRMAKKLQGYQPYARMVETVLYAAICALVSGGVSLLAECLANDPGEDVHLQYVQFNCDEGKFNPIASLLVSTSHSSVKLLFAGSNGHEIRHQPCISAFAAYYLLNVFLTGLPVPGGAFTATMLLGGLFGRFFGCLFQELGIVTSLSGMYAVVGSAAMLCGFKQMTLAVVLIVIECVNDLQLGPLVMLGVFVSMSVNWLVNETGHDEEQIKRKNLPFLEGEAPRGLDHLVALDLCDHLPKDAILPVEAHVSDIKRILKESKLCDFPIVDETGAVCLGIITRPHLEAALQTVEESQINEEPKSAHKKSRAFLEDPFEGKDSADKVLGSFMKVLSGSMLSGEKLPLNNIMDPTPFTIVEDMPAPRLYALFAKAGERAACVVSRRGGFRGIISRAALISATRRVHG